MDMPLTQSLERIISERGERAKALDGRISEWMAVSDELRRLGAAIQDLSAHPASPGALVGLLPQIENLPARIEREVLPRLRRVQQRFSRSTLNIGVAGEARMGKSTLLQAISGSHITIYGTYKLIAVEECTHDPRNPDYCPTGSFRKSERGIADVTVEVYDEQDEEVVVSAASAIMRSKAGRRARRK